jgi:PilZ domain
MGNPVCKRCSMDYVCQSPQTGAIARMLSTVHMSPFRCQLCANRFWVMRWKDFRKSSRDNKREYQRLLVEFPLTFRGEHSKGKGTVTTLSIQGCTIDTDSRLQHGAKLSLTMHIPALKFRIELDAVVKRALGRRFGMKFLKMDAVDKKRLQNHIETLIVTGPSELRKMFLDV